MDLYDFLVRSKRDPLLEDPLRYLGFVNDLGEATKAFLPKPIYYGTYAITGSYAIGSCINGRLRHQFQSGNNSVELAKTNRITYDMMIWHFFATVSVTPVLIHKSKDLSKKILGLMKFSDKKVKFGSSVIGIALIPVLVPPVDNATHYIMNKYFRTAEEQKPYEWHGLYSSLNKEH